MEQIPNHLGLIAGKGGLPEMVIADYIDNNRNIFVISLGCDSPSLNMVPNIKLSIGSVGKAIKTLRTEGIRDIVFAGKITRPKFSSLRPDAAGVKLMTKITASKFKGDNSILSIVIKFFENSGFTVHGVEQILDSLLVVEGTIGSIEPNKSAQNDIFYGMDIAKAIGNLDIGQSVIVQHGVTIGVEAVEGTDSLIERCAKYKLENPGPILVKMKKPIQDSRIDLPTIGVTTIEKAHNSGLRGIAIEAGAALLVEKNEIAKRADELGLFVVGI